MLLLITYITIKLWSWKWHWKSRVTLKFLWTKETSNTENFSVWFKFFHCKYSVLEQQRNIFQCDYHCGFLCKYFSEWFPCLFSSVTLIFSLTFSVIISYSFGALTLHWSQKSAELFASLNMTRRGAKVGNTAQRMWLNRERFICCPIFTLFAWDSCKHWFCTLWESSAFTWMCLWKPEATAVWLLRTSKI